MLNHQRRQAGAEAIEVVAVSILLSCRGRPRTLSWLGVSIEPAMPGWNALSLYHQLHIADITTAITTLRCFPFGVLIRSVPAAMDADDLRVYQR